MADIENISKVIDVDPTFNINLGNTVRSPGAGLRKGRKTLLFLT